MDAALSDVSAVATLFPLLVMSEDEKHQVSFELMVAAASVSSPSYMR
jgi:hypothetical protein